jgi:hypothetical protein
MPAARTISLRRSCKACVKAKRRCEPRFPACKRCVSKSLECVYENEPLVGRGDSDKASAYDTSTTITPEPKEAISGHSLIPQKTVLPSFLQLITIQHLAQQLYSPELPGAGLNVYEPTPPDVEWRCDEATLHCLVGHLKAFPTTFAREGSTPFIHPQLYDQSLPKQIQDVYTICGSYLSVTGGNKAMVFPIMQQKFNELMEKHSNLHRFEDVLASVQALMLYLTIRLFDGDTQQRRLAEPYVHTLGQWARQLWKTAPSQTPESLSPWQAWVFAESVRRSILIACLIQGVYSRIKRGYSKHTLFVEALPFDVHTTKWDAQSTTAWEAVAGEPQSSMVSYREYVERFSEGRVKSLKDFEVLLLIACHGKNNFERALQSGSFPGHEGQALP